MKNNQRPDTLPPYDETKKGSGGDVGSGPGTVRGQYAYNRTAQVRDANGQDRPGARSRYTIHNTRYTRIVHKYGPLLTVDFYQATPQDDS